MKKKIIIIIAFLLLLFPKETIFAESTTPTKICVNGWTFEISNWGSKVDPWKLDSLDRENFDVKNESLLPDEYFKMKDDFKTARFTIEQVDSSLTKYNSNQLINPSIKTFLDKYYNTYINPTNKEALKNYNVEKQYAFDVTYLGLRCNKNIHDDGTYDVMFCPSKDIYSIYNSDNFNSVIGKLKFENGVFKYTISDKSSDIVNKDGEKVGSFGGNLTVRIVPAGNSTNLASSFNINSYNISEIPKNGSATIVNLPKDGVITRSLNAGESVFVEFYLKQDVTGATYKPCAGSMLGYVQFAAPKYAYVANPFLNDTVCTTLKNASNIPNAYKPAYVPDCYRKEVEYFTELQGNNKTKLYNKILANISELEELFENSEVSKNSITNLKCHYNPEKKKEINKNGEKYAYQVDGSLVLEKEVATRKYIYQPIESEFWTADCTETLTVLYDQPKQVLAGTGFPYIARLEVKRTCTPKLKKEVESLPPCSYGVECYGGPPGNVHDGGGGAGPNEDFDNCVKNCDGGNYTQKCINSCYSSVYEKKESKTDKMFSFLDEAKAQNLNLTTNSKKGAITRISATGLKEGDTTPRGNIIYGNPITSNKHDGAGYDCSQSNQSCTVTYPNDESYTFPFASVLCDGVWCYTVRLNEEGKCGGINTAQKERSDSDYDKLINELANYTSTEKSEMSIIDSYLKNEDKSDLKKTTWTKLLTPVIEVESGVKCIKPTTKSIKYAADGSMKSNVPNVEVSKTYEIEIPYAYVTMINPETAEKTVRYSKQNNSAQDNEQGAVREYFTDIKSGKFNDYVSTKWKEGDTREFKAAIDSNKVGHNINVIFSTIGTLIGKDEKGKDIYTWDKVNIDCFYGVYNDIDIPPCDPPCKTPDITPPPCTPPCETPDIIKTGRQYVFRPVNLTNLFPNRAPRWNWNYTAKIGDSYTADAKKIIADIEKTGNDAYNHKPEYEFVITKENIRNIRKYNNEKNRTYQTYDDMECKTIAASGIKYCVSGFMDNTDYVSKFTRDITVLGQNTNKNG